MVVRKGAGVDKCKMDENERFFLNTTIILARVIISILSCVAGTTSTMISKSEPFSGEKKIFPGSIIVYCSYPGKTKIG